MVVQDERTRDVVMVAYMNAEALELTRSTGRAHYYSRSRNKLWLKGETSVTTRRCATSSSIATEIRSCFWSIKRSPPVTRATGTVSTGPGKRDGPRWAKRPSMRKRFTATRDRLCEWFVTCSYTGYLPLAPGTWASALACIILYFVPSFDHPAVIALLVVLAIFATERIRAEERDPRYIVIDELIGMLVATADDLTKWNIVKAFMLFRAFDILKPYPIKKVERLPGAYGIIADDVLAGIFASIALFIWAHALA